MADATGALLFAINHVVQPLSFDQGTAQGKTGRDPNPSRRYCALFGSDSVSDLGVALSTLRAPGFAGTGDHHHVRAGRRSLYGPLRRACEIRGRKDGASDRGAKGWRFHSIFPAFLRHREIQSVENHPRRFRFEWVIVGAQHWGATLSWSILSGRYLAR